MDVHPIPGLEHLPWAEVWFHEIDDARWLEASAAARQIGKTGLEVWTTDKTPEVVRFLDARDYAQVRHYLITELDVATAPDPDPPAFPLVTFAERPDLAEALYAVALESYPDQPGRSGGFGASFETWRPWGLDPHPPEAYFIALEDGRVLGYGYLEVEDGTWKNGFMAVTRANRGRGIAGAIKRAQIAWAKEHGVPTLRTATERRLTQMRALNERHGYRLLYEEIILRGPVAPED
jgi:GNAT superfamily N-acetyltransferase